MAKELTQIHLSGTGLSGRCVRIQELSTKQLNAVELAAAQGLTPQSKQIEFDNAIAAIGVRVMVVAVSEPTAAGALPVGWREVDALALEKEAEELFTARDLGVLAKVFRRMHVVTEAEVDAIMGGKIGVVT